MEKQKTRTSPLSFFRINRAVFFKDQPLLFVKIYIEIKLYPAMLRLSTFAAAIILI